MLTEDILFGMNILTLASIGLMSAGTALVSLGLHAGGWSK